MQNAPPSPPHLAPAFGLGADEDINSSPALNALAPRGKAGLLQLAYTPVSILRSMLDEAMGGAAVDGNGNAIFPRPPGGPYPSMRFTRPIQEGLEFAYTNNTMRLHQLSAMLHFKLTKTDEEITSMKHYLRALGGANSVLYTASHRCNVKMCIALGHVILEHQEINNSRQRCTIACPHCAGILCQHIPVCLPGEPV
jgi:hypothetical protein